MQFGIEDPHSGAVLQARIKIVASDFEVIEVDTNGQPCPTSAAEAAAASYAHPIIPPNPNKKDPKERRREALVLEPVETIEAALELCEKDVALADAVRLLAENGGAAVELGIISDKAARGTLRLTVGKFCPQLDSALKDDVLSVARWVHWPLFVRCIGPDASKQLRWRYAERKGFPELRIPFLQGVEKEDRREFYAALTQHMGLLKCRTADGVLVCRLPEKKNVGEKRNREAQQPPQPQVFTHFVAKKTNVDIFELRDVLAAKLGVRQNEVVTAGIKDKRAVTTQRCSVPGDVSARWCGGATLPIELPSAWSGMTRGVELYAPAAQAEQLYIGALDGNVFKIAVYPTTTTSGGGDALMDRAARFKDDPTFPNFFGPQRFGQVPDMQGHIGIHAVRGDFAGAVAAAFLDADPDDSSAAAKKLFRETGDAAAALKIAPDRNRDLNLMLQQLVKCKRSRNDVSAEAWNAACEEVLLALPYHLRQIWMHAAQSLVFNVALSKLLVAGSVGGPTSSEASLLFCQSEDDSVQLSSDHRAGRGVVLPLLGYATVVAVKGMAVADGAESAVHAALREALAELRIPSLERFCGNPLKVALRGSWRKAIVAAGPFNAVRMESPASGRAGVRLSFQLPSSSYATCLMHRVLGCFPASGGEDTDEVEEAEV